MTARHYQLEQVFNEAEFPWVTFVQPKEFPHIRSALRAKGKHITLSGPSGSGKTTLVRQLMRDESISDAHLLWLNARQYTNAESCFDMLGRAVQEAPEFDAVTPYLGSVEFVIVDDFHHLTKSARTELARHLKLWHEYSVRFIIVGIASSANELLDIDPELGIRNEAYEISTQNEEFTRKLIDSGTNALKTKFSHSLRSEIVEASRGIPSVTQLVCRACCIEAGIYETQNEAQDVDLRLADLREAVLRVFHGKYLQKVVGLAKGKRAARSVHNTYFDIIEAIKNSDKMEVPKEYLYAKVVRTVKGVAAQRRKATSFYNCLNNLSDVIEDRKLSDVLHFPHGGTVITIEDPSFRFYLDLMSIDDVRSRIHLREDEYPYDVAVSFAGSDRRTVERFVAELRQRGISVFYDFDQQAQLWGQDLREKLSTVYAKEARYMIVFVSKDYPERDWTDFELAIGKDAEAKRTTEYLLPVVLDDTRVVGLKSTRGHIDLRHTDLAEVAEILDKKLSALSDADAQSSPAEGMA